MPDVEALVATRRSLHAVAEWVLAPARHRAEGRIGLRATPGGFGTPVFGNRRLRVEGTDLVIEHSGASRSAPLTTLGAAAALAGIEPGRDTGTYPPQTMWEADTPLELDPAAAAELADWFAFATAVLEELRHDSVAPSIVQLWPEHFDVATSVGDEPTGHRVNLGASPGDADHPRPYLYVGPWHPVDRSIPFWNEPFGAALGWDELAEAPDQETAALGFLRRGRDLA